MKRGDCSGVHHARVVRPQSGSATQMAEVRLTVSIALITAFCGLGVGADQKVSATRERTHQSLLIDVRADLTVRGIHPVNAAGDGQTDDTVAIQLAIDGVAQHGGGTVIMPAGVYRIRSVTIPDKVRLVGAGPRHTILRGIDASKYMITVRGGEIMGFSAYGTPTKHVSGEHWKVGTGGQGEGSTAKPTHVIAVRDAHGGAVISDVHAFEARHDCLYVRGSRGLKVLNCTFDRAGRNIVSMVGNDEDFVFSECRFGSLWGLYHFDIEPGDDRHVRDGLFVNCVFDGTQAGLMGTDTWGAFLCFSGHGELASRNISVVRCTFKNIYIRVRGVFPQAAFLYNEMNRKPVYVRVKSNSIGELRGAVVRGNQFPEDATSRKDIIYGVTFGSDCVFTDNVPAITDQGD
jgi:hypothetical protein